MKTRLTILLAALVLGGLSMRADDVILEWNPNDPAEQVTEYRVYESPSVNGPWTQIASTSDTSVTLDLQPAEHFFYVSAVNVWGESPPSDVVDTPEPPTPPINTRLSIP